MSQRKQLRYRAKKQSRDKIFWWKTNTNLLHIKGSKNEFHSNARWRLKSTSVKEWTSFNRLPTYKLRKPPFQYEWLSWWENIWSTLLKMRYNSNAMLLLHFALRQAVKHISHIMFCSCAVWACRFLVQLELFPNPLTGNSGYLMG